jgi:polysaccharide export outer membrane protein
MAKGVNMMKRTLPTIILAFILLLPGLGHTQSSTSFPRESTSRQKQIYQSLTPAQRQAIAAEEGRTGGVLTPEGVEALRGRPEFKGLTAEDVVKGRELLEKGEPKPAEKNEPGPPARTIIMEGAPKKSLFDRNRTLGGYQDISLDLQPFGYDFFREAAVRVFTERRDIPVPMKYLVGPGDEVRILLWGRMNEKYNLVVDRDGKITVPVVGPITVAGMTFEEMSKKIIDQAGQITGTNVDVSMGSLRTVPIFVLGDVKRPGTYTIGSLATITDALLLAGGPTEIGSMRRIELKRKDRLIVTFDLYDLLLKGDKSKDMVLQGGDVVFVPVTGPQAGIAGNVKRPAIYEMKDRKDLLDLMDMAGGIIPTAYTQQIQVERIIKNEKQVVVDIDDKNLTGARDFALQDADLVKIFSIVDIKINTVYLNGNVKRPGTYEYRPGMRIGDLIKDTGELMPETHFNYALIKRLNPPDLMTTLIPFNLGAILLDKDEKHNVALQPRDSVYIFSRWFFRDKTFVTVEGEIRGECKVLDAPQAKPLTDTVREPVDQEKADSLLRLQEQKKTVVAEDVAERRGATTKLTPGQLRLQEQRKTAVAEDIARQRGVETKLTPEQLRRMGRFQASEEARAFDDRQRRSCPIELSLNMKIKDAILHAGGLTSNTYLERGQIIRLTEKNEYKTLYFHVGRAMADDPRENHLLQDKDRVVLHSVWEEARQQTVAIAGEVMRPGTYQYTRDMTVQDIIFKAGNILESAYLQDAELTSMIVDDEKEVRFDYRNFSLKKALAGDPQSNLRLKPYDRLFVKRITGWRDEEFVSVSGEVPFPGRYVVKKGEKLSTLIERAGGYTSKAYLRGAVFTRTRVQELQQQNLTEIASRMERDLLSGGAASVATSLSAEEVRAKEVELAQKQKLVQKIRELKATGRMTIRIAHLRLLKGSEYDIELEDGDQLHIPQANNVINVSGAVMTQGSYIFMDRYAYEDYIAMTGGYTNYADINNTFVLKVDGSARKLARGMLGWNAGKSRWELAHFGEPVKEIEPGDTIVVPEKVENIAWLREIRDITQILMQLAVTAAVTIKLF